MGTHLATDFTASCALALSVCCQSTSVQLINKKYLLPPAVCFSLFQPRVDFTILQLKSKTVNEFVMKSFWDK